ncbi:hypothetical protein ACLOJK_004449 [Asimina triloba]
MLHESRRPTASPAHHARSRPIPHDSSNCPMPISKHRPRSQQITPTSNSSSSARSPLPNPSAPSTAPQSNRTIRQHHAIRRCPVSVAHVHPIQSLPATIRPPQIMAKPIGHQLPLIERRWQLRPCCRTHHLPQMNFIFHLASEICNSHTVQQQKISSSEES